VSFFWDYEGVSGNGEADRVVRNLCMSVIIKCTALCGVSSTTSSSLEMMAGALMDSIYRAEHMAGFVAEICSKCHRGFVLTDDADDTGDNGDEDGTGTGTDARTKYTGASSSRSLCSEIMSMISRKKASTDKSDKVTHKHT
jgi:hypothetical protein